MKNSQFYDKITCMEMYHRPIFFTRNILDNLFEESQVNDRSSSISFTLQTFLDGIRMKIKSFFKMEDHFMMYLEILENCFIS